MSEEMGRREALRVGFLMAVGSLGVGASALAASPALAAAAEEGEPVDLVLLGSEWHRQSATSDAGDAPVPGERATVYGRLSSADGAEVGHFQAASFYGESPFADGGSSSLEFHTFTLGDDVIFGMGNAGETAGVFTVVGGAGRFAGARGSYTAQQSPHELGGEGTARFDITLL
jgi:hypothetical protein